ncbi:TRAP transporter substrate-binding protein [Cupriavidus sp. 2MCAB6]|uniref:TRAP transporter substrate-binding protein n=1 Tax=Cupriavidus sp. 2MCAB6 TaxID=3232981 RepID=UPI003F8D92B2
MESYDVCNAFRRKIMKSSLALAAGSALPRVAMGADAPVVLRCSSAMPVDQSSAQYLWFERFRECLRAAVGERIRVDYFPNGQLGKEADVVQQVRLGSIDMMVTGSSIWATALPELALLDLGYLFDGWTHLARALDGGVAARFDAMLRERTGCRVIGWGAFFNARSVYTRHPVTSLAALQKVKLRVLPTQIFVDTFRLMGAIPTPIPFNEVYTAVQTGVVAGFEHDAASVLANKLNEVVGHCWLTEHLFSASVAVLGKRAWEKLPLELQAPLLQAAAQASAYQREVAPQRGQRAMDALRQLGLAFHPMRAAERESVRSRMQAQLWPGFTASYPATRPLLAAIEAARA